MTLRSFQVHVVAMDGHAIAGFPASHSRTGAKDDGRRVEIPQAREPVEPAAYERSDTVVDRKATA